MTRVLNPVNNKPMEVKKGVLPCGGYYVPSTKETVTWETLPNIDSKPVLSVPSASVVTFDTVSHETFRLTVLKSGDPSPRAVYLASLSSPASRRAKASYEVGSRPRIMASVRLLKPGVPLRSKNSYSELNCASMSGL